MSDSPAIDVAHIARLAQLALNKDEMEQMGRDLQVILGYVAELAAVDVTGVRPMSHPLPFLRPLRPDVAGPALPQATALAAAPVADDSAFVVPKVL